MKNLLYCVLGFLIGIIVATVLVKTTNLFDKIKSDKTQVINQENNQVVSEFQEDSITTIQDYLKFREHVRELNRADSVFFTIPDVVLVNILSDFGTDISTYEIATIYEDYPDIYNIVKSGAKSQMYLDSINSTTQIPNVLPMKAPIDSVIESWSDN